MCTRIEIDGGPPVERPWGETVFPVQPDRHTVTCFFPWTLFRKAGKATVSVDVVPGEVADITYVVPMVMFMAGQWDIGANAREHSRTFPKAVVGQMIATGFILLPLFAQTITRSAAWWAVVPILALVPILLSAREISRDR